MAVALHPIPGMENEAAHPRLRNSRFDVFLVTLGCAILVIPPIWPRFALGTIALVALGWTTRRKLAGEIDRLDSIVNAVGDPIFVKDEKHRFRLVNRAFCAFAGRTAAELLGNTDTHAIQSSVTPAMRVSDDQVLKTGAPADSEATFTDRLGVTRVAHTHTTRFIDRNGRRNVVGVIRDITERKKAEEALARSEERYALATFGSNDGILDWDVDARRVYVSPRWKALLGYSNSEIGEAQEEVLGRIHPDDRARSLGAQAAHLRGETPQFEVEIRMRHKDGTYRWMMSRGRAIRDASGRPIRMAGSQRDISDIKALENRLRQESSRDALTGLFNRRQFFTMLKPALAAARRHGQALTVCMADIDAFKGVNDAHGHAAGDEVLEALGRSIAAGLRDSDVAARYGGDEFCFFFPHTTAEDARTVLERIRARVAGRRFFDSSGSSYSVTMTVGAVDLNDEDADAAALVERADAALYEGKRLGRDRLIIRASGARIGPLGRAIAG